MSVFLLIVFISISYVVVTAGATALEMTGMEKSRARFQALSAFSGTGFTTREAEQIVNHPRRRKIVMYLMILGNAGLVSVIATFVVSLRRSTVFGSSLNLVIIVIALFLLYRLATHQRFAVRLTEGIREELKERLHFDKVLVQEILQQADGFGIASVLVGTDSLIAGKKLNESGLREKDVMVLSIERDEGVIPLPRADATIEARDRLICYGKLENIRESI